MPWTAMVYFVLLPGTIAAGPASDDPPALERRYERVVVPFLRDHCVSCHGVNKQEAKLDLRRFGSAQDVAGNPRAWERVLENLEAETMPPDDAPRQPGPDQRQAVVAWIREFRQQEARKHAGDPGVVLARRLSNAEFDNTIRDLTGVDIRPTREFPVDPANEAGFDNSGESLAMSPALLQKYLAAARLVADHLVLKPDGFTFAPHPVVTDTDRDHYCVQRIIAFYERHRVDLADYFHAAWRFRHREPLGTPDATLAGLAAEAGLSARYLTTVWTVLAEPWPQDGPLGELQTLWRRLPDGTGAADVAAARQGCERIRDRVLILRKTFEPRVGTIRVNGISPGSQPFVLWRNRELAERHMRPPDNEAPRDVAEFCRVFPDTFFVAARGAYFDAKLGAQARLLTAGFHLMQGYFRDDRPLYELVLDDDGRRELDTLWRELDFVTLVPMRQYKDFIFFERAEPPRFASGPEFDFARSEDRDVTSAAKIERMRALYLARAREKGADANALASIETYFREIDAAIRAVERGRADAEPSHLAALQRFAERAYRRPLSQDERDGLIAFYQRLRADDALSHEDAIRDSITRILLSPHFCYRFDRATEGPGARPLSGFELASRLSYFLWASMPDDELLDHAARGDLGEPDVLRAQARRMLRDPRVRALATEFVGNWLGFRRFEEHHAVDRDRFPSFTNELRQAMYEEPIHFIVDLISHDRPVLDLLDADDTFVNPVLARHYGMPVPDGGPDHWVRVEDARRYGRGGLPPMAVFLTVNSPGLRTSPVKRGHWVVRRLLGETIPAPPPEVPELPKDEAQLGDLSLPQLLARHRQVKSCATCHQRFDSVGLAFEGFGPIGERRTLDLGGRPVETRAVFPDGLERDGLDGLRQYLAGPRRDDFLDNLCRKLLVYALGRGLILSDEPTVERMRADLAADQYRFGRLVETIVLSPPFRNKRGSADPPDRDGIARVRSTPADRNSP